MQNPDPIDQKVYEEKNWQEKVMFIRSFKSEPVKPPNQQIFKEGLLSSSVAVQLAVLKQLIKFRSKAYRKNIIALIDFEDPMVRWHAMIYLEKMPIDSADLKIISERFRDEEWLVRESAFRSIRRYRYELQKKKYLIPIMFSLSEKNANVLRQIYRTLRWYQDEKVFPFLFKRSYHTRSAMELMIVMNELSHYKRGKVLRRLKQIARKDKRGFIRHEAEKLIAEF